MKEFRAYRIDEKDGKIEAGFETLSIDDLSDGDVIIKVSHSTINYKDALAATGAGRILRRFPLVGGIDLAGTVVSSGDQRFGEGDPVLVNGCGLGETRDGGYAEYARVPADAVVPIPDGLDAHAAMQIGTAGFTAALAIHRMEQNGQEPMQGPVVVTGATGGVGSIAVAILAKLGYQVVAATGKSGEKEFLTGLGAKGIISREEATDNSGRPLLKSRWAGVVDSVGGEILATTIKSTGYHGLVACCGNAASADFATNVYPFILRGVSLLGIDSAQCPLETRSMIWDKLAGEWKVDFSKGLISECTLAELDEKIDAILAGKIRGRVVVNLQ